MSQVKEMQELYEAVTSKSAKKLVKVIDETGRDAVPEPNRFYIYVYSDGSREKRMIVK